MTSECALGEEKIIENPAFRAKVLQLETLFREAAARSLESCAGAEVLSAADYQTVINAKGLEYSFRLSNLSFIEFYSI